MSKFKKSLISNLRALFWALIIAGFIRSFIVEPFKIPSGSMKPNLLVGDFLFVSKWDYGYSRYSFPFGLPFFEGKFFEKSPQRGDIIVFKLPTKENINYVKRLVALPGETIKVLDGMIYIKNKNSDYFILFTQKEIDPFYDDQYDTNIMRLKENNSNIKFILTEMGTYFNKVTKPRVQRIIFSEVWKKGQPSEISGSPAFIKYHNLESYEDALNNLQLKPNQAQQQLLDTNSNMQEEYLLQYMLDVESRDQLLNIEAFKNPFNYNLNITCLLYTSDAADE